MAPVTLAAGAVNSDYPVIACPDARVVTTTGASGTLTRSEATVSASVWTGRGSESGARWYPVDGR